MYSLLLVVALIAVVTVWVRGTRANRLRWLSQLNLPGVWHSDDSGVELSFEFRGELDQGRYSESSVGAVREGAWQLQGNNLLLSPTQSEPNGGQALVCDLTLFDKGRIGLNGPGYEHRVFIKAVDNVVPLRTHRDQ